MVIIKWIFYTASSFKEFSNTKILSKQKPRFNGIFYRDNLQKIKDEAYIINLNEYSDIGTPWVALHMNNDVTYFDNFGAEHIPKEIKTFINSLLSSALQNKTIKTNMFRIQAYDSVMC